MTAPIGAHSKSLIRFFESSDQDSAIWPLWHPELCERARAGENVETSRAEAHTRATNACGGGRFLVGPERIELSTDGLKVHCSTTELRAQEQYSRCLAGAEGRAVWREWRTSLQATRYENPTNDGAYRRGLKFHP